MVDQVWVGFVDDGFVLFGEEEGEGGGEVGGKELVVDVVLGFSVVFCFMVIWWELVVKLQYVVSGLELLVWFEDYCVFVFMVCSIVVLEFICDVYNFGQDLVIYCILVFVFFNSCFFKVGLKIEVVECKEKFVVFKDFMVSQIFMLDRVFNFEGKVLLLMRGFKYISWFFMGCDVNGRCFLVVLIMDNCLIIQVNFNRLQWVQLVDLIEIYGECFYEISYRFFKNEGLEGNFGDFVEFQRRYSMQILVRMEWLGICIIQQVKYNNECWDVGSVFLVVFFENGNIVVWQFQLFFVGKEFIFLCNMIELGIIFFSVLFWWEYEYNN